MPPQAEGAAALRMDERALEHRGFTLLPGLATAADLAEFERVIGAFCEAQIAVRGIVPRHSDPFVDVMLADPEYRRHIFPLLPRFQIVERIAADVGARLERTGFLARRKFRAPLIWPYVRADLPHEEEYQLPFHQDVRSTLSAKAFRVWLPLRSVDRHYGSMELVAGSHTMGALPHSAGARPEVRVEKGWRDEDCICIEAAAGDGVLFHPAIIHRSVQNRSDRVKFVILIQIQDAAEVLEPGRPA